MGRTMSDITWFPANGWGIQMQLNVWHAGRVNDVLVLQTGAEHAGGVLVGADGGGVWLTNVPGAGASPLSDDWDNPDIMCLAQGPNSPSHIYAGCGNVSGGTGALYETAYEADITVALALETWHDISPPNSP